MTSILTVATHTFYPRFQRRLLNSLRATGYSGNIKSWTGSLPDGCPHHNEQPYAFKLYAFREAGADIALWLDSGLYAVKAIDPILERIMKDGYYLVACGDRLYDWSDSGVLRHYGVSDEAARAAPLVSGALIGLDLSSEIGKFIFKTLWEAYQMGFYKNTISQHSGKQGHRGDESILGIMALTGGLKLHTLNDHFGSDQEPKESTVLRSGYHNSLTLISEHTIQTPELGPVLEVGCRNFDFAKGMRARGHTVYVFDPGRHIHVPRDMRFWDRAIVKKSLVGSRKYVDFDNGTGNFIMDVQNVIPMDAKIYPVECISIERAMELCGVQHFGIIKLDCEAAEYGILEEWPGPIADQVTVEFHEHIAPHDMEPLMAQMKKWYHLVQHEKSVRHCLSTPNFWDTLFVLNGS